MVSQYEVQDIRNSEVVSFPIWINLTLYPALQFYSNEVDISQCYLPFMIPYKLTESTPNMEVG